MARYCTFGGVGGIGIFRFWGRNFGRLCDDGTIFCPRIAESYIWRGFLVPKVGLCAHPSNSIKCPQIPLKLAPERDFGRLRGAVHHTNTIKSELSFAHDLPTGMSVASIERRGKRWRVRVYVNGQRDSGTFATKAEASAWALEREAQLKGSASVPYTLADAMDRYDEVVVPKHRGSRWETLRLGLLKRDEAISGKRLDALTGADIASWRERRLRQVSAASVRREWNLLRSVFEYARTDLRWISENPMRDVKRPPAPPHRDRRISDGEIERIRLALGWPTDDAPANRPSAQVAVMFLLAIETAMRAGEMSGLTWDRVDLKQRFVRLPKTKNGTARDVPLSRRAVDLLKRLMPPKGQHAEAVFSVKPGSRDALFRKARDAAGSDDLHFHDTRAEAIIRLSKKLDVLELARMVGHRDPRSLMIYYRPTATQIAERLD